ncbi:MAG TPA: hypothetical protein VEG63_11965, partial [Candidatus Acidoferrales bacterium]|nr:hypothetical protein [Candidatus Acidoferrales bacterium]
MMRAVASGEMGLNATLVLLGAGVIAALATIVGGWLVARREWSRRYLRYLLGLGAGFMLAAVFLEVIPEAYELSGRRALLLVLAGYLVVHLFVHTLSQHVH